MENNSNRKSRKGIIIAVVIIIFVLVSLAGMWFGSKAFYAEQPKTIKVNAASKVYNYVDLPMISSIILIGGNMDVVGETCTTRSFAELISEFSETPLEELIDSDAFPYEVPILGSVEGFDGTCYIVQGSSGNYYVIVQ